MRICTNAAIRSWNDVTVFEMIFQTSTVIKKKLLSGVYLHRSRGAATAASSWLCSLSHTSPLDHVSARAVEKCVCVCAYVWHHQAGHLVEVKKKAFTRLVESDWRQMMRLADSNNLHHRQIMAMLLQLCAGKEHPCGQNALPPVASRAKKYNNHIHSRHGARQGGFGCTFLFFLFYIFFLISVCQVQVHTSRHHQAAATTYYRVFSWSAPPL